MGEETKQDVWFVDVAVGNNGKTVFKQRGIIDLPFLMSSFDAADYALRYTVRETLKGMPVGPGNSIVATIYGKTSTMPGERRVRCSGLARFDAERGEFMRQTPWVQDGAQMEIGSSDGVVIHPLDWR